MQMQPNMSVVEEFKKELSFLSREQIHSQEFQEYLKTLLEDYQCRDCQVEARKHCDECGGYGSDEDEDDDNEGVCVEEIEDKDGVLYLVEEDTGIVYDYKSWCEDEKMVKVGVYCKKKGIELH